MEKKSSLLEVIKSLYILKNIFLFLKPNISCNLVKYNNQLKEKLEYFTDDYLKASNYLIRKVENKGTGIGVESHYKDQNIVFLGNYINYKKNGLGNEFFRDGKIKFIGEYSNGKKISGYRYDKYKNIILTMKDGKSEEKFRNKKLKFFGQYKEDKKWYGKGYDYFGNEVYEIKEGKGRVIEYYDDGVVKFIGNYEFGERNGLGIKLDHDGFIVYVGTYKNGEKWTGKGIEYYFSSGHYFDIPFPLVPRSSISQEKKPNDYKYEGPKKTISFVKIDLNILNYISDLEIDMNITNDKQFFMNIPPVSPKPNLVKGFPQMQGFQIPGSMGSFLQMSPISQINTMKFKNIFSLIKPINNINGDKDSINNLPGDDNEPGYYIHREKFIATHNPIPIKRRKYEGEYFNGKKHGEGKEYCANPSYLQYEGHFSNDLRNVYGREYNLSYDIRMNEIVILSYEGEYLNGKRNGYGKVYLSDGSFKDVKYFNGKEV